MPKMKSNRGAAKTFKLTASGKVKRHKAFKSHILTSKSRKRKRNLRKGVIASASDEKKIKIMIQ
ncbi:MAG: 50S ribosomal protein L35 [Ignavibacteria bacterium]